MDKSDPRVKFVREMLMVKTVKVLDTDTRELRFTDKGIDFFSHALFLIVQSKTYLKKWITKDTIKEWLKDYNERNDEQVLCYYIVDCASMDRALKLLYGHFMSYCKWIIENDEIIRLEDIKPLYSNLLPYNENEMKGEELR